MRLGHEPATFPQAESTEAYVSHSLTRGSIHQHRGWPKEAGAAGPHSLDEILAQLELGRQVF